MMAQTRRSGDRVQHGGNLAEDRAQTGGHAGQERTRRDRDEAGHQRVFDRVLTASIPPDFAQSKKKLMVHGFSIVTKTNA